jgi:predicted nucleic acid-binding protein
MTTATLPILLLDTNILSYMYRNEPLGDQYAQHFRGHSTVICFQTLAELRYGMQKAGWGETRRQDQEKFMRQFRVIYPTDSVCTAWASSVDGARKAGRPIDSADAWIAATALALRCPLVTHNAADFAGVPGLKIITEPDQTEQVQ